MAITKKGSVGTEQILGQAAQQITKAVNELNSATSTLDKLTQKSEELTLQVANKEEAIKALQVEYEEKERQLKVELDLNFKSNTDRVVTHYLATINKVAVPVSELEELRSELENNKQNSEELIKHEVSVLSDKLKQKYETEIKIMQSENKAITAENTAKLTSLKEQNSFLEKQVAKLYEQLESERNAGIERAKASSIGSINLGDSGRK